MRINNSQTKRTVNKSVIRDSVGRLRVRQCRVKLSYEPYISLNRRNQPTFGDIESQLQRKIRLINQVFN